MTGWHPQLNQAPIRGPFGVSPVTLGENPTVAFVKHLLSMIENWYKVIELYCEVVIGYIYNRIKAYGHLARRVLGGVERAAEAQHLVG